MWKNGPSLALRMTLLVLGGTILVFTLIMGDDYLSTRRAILAQAEENARNMAAAVSHRIEQEFRATAKIPENLAVFLEISPPKEDALLELLRRLVTGNREIYGSTAAFEPYAFDPNRPAYAPYYYMDKDGLKFVQLGTEQYNYFKWDWYKIPKESKTAVWSEPYFDEGGGGIIMCTYSVPFFHHADSGQPGRLTGIVTADISLDWLTRLIATVRPSRTGFGFLLSRKGIFISHPEKSLILRESIFNLAQKAGDNSLAELGRQMTEGRTGVIRHKSILTEAQSFLAFIALPTTGWSLGLVFPEQDLLAELSELNQRTAMMAGLGVILLFLVILFISRSITGPLRRMAQSAARVAGGDLDLDLSDLFRADEVGRLAQAFNGMAADLKKHIQDLTEATAARERIESELNIAAQIQKSILPSTFPPFPERSEFELFAFMKPAREIGGDFYDFFFLDDQTLALVIADVSGKGVPSALFMMVSRTLIKSFARQGKTPAEVLAETNDLLCQGNEAAMFVTVFLAYYDVANGRLRYANGGHNPVMVLQANEVLRELKVKGGPALGFQEGLPYRMGEDSLNTDDLLVFYTDGVTEAVSGESDMFGLTRFKKILLRNQLLEPADLCRRVHDELEKYQAGRQFDDMTLMILRRTG
ncbi:MAG: SpoIIE family protein phosphatase [Thermodesulfobacteriota bacterium]